MIPTLERASLEEAVRLAREMTSERLQTSPRSPLFVHADEQLRFIEGFVTRNEMPTLEDTELIDVGLMAVKELEPDDPDYAKALMRAAGRFESLLDDFWTWNTETFPRSERFDFGAPRAGAVFTKVSQTSAQTRSGAASRGQADRFAKADGVAGKTSRLTEDHDPVGPRANRLAQKVRLAGRVQAGR
jgi:hypothetical protein